jgi:hypothetical protein
MVIWRIAWDLDESSFAEVEANQKKILARNIKEDKYK